MCQRKMRGNGIKQRSHVCVVYVLVCAVCLAAIQHCRGHSVSETSTFKRGSRVLGLKEKALLLAERVKRDLVEDETSHTQAEMNSAKYNEFLQNIFSKYGRDGVLTFEGFEHLLENIGLANVDITDHGLEAHQDWQTWLHDDHNHTAEEVDRVKVKCNEESHSRRTRRGTEAVSSSDHEEHVESERLPGGGGKNGSRLATNHSTECFSPVQLLRLHQLNETSVLTMSNFLSLCPTLIYQLDVHSCSLSSHQHQQPYLQKHSDGHYHDHHDPDHRVHDGNATSGGWTSPQMKVWGYAILACVIISAVGLICVCIIPIMHRVIYNHMLQFLVALAIGSLSGDALLHLLPHAMAPHDASHDHSHADHDHVVWLGLMAVGGIYLFFVIEQLIKICSDRKQTRQEKIRTEASLNSENLRLETGSQNNTALQTTFIDAAGGEGAAGDTNTHRSSPMIKRPKNGVGSRLAEQGGVATSCEEMIMIVHTNKDIRVMSDSAHDDVHRHCNPAAVKEDIWKNNHSKNGHHHSHKVPSSVASVAWMVIVGDGFHNFADGLAIGSAFARSMTDGLSTSIAVLCHELPHELGDFAMLLNAGMSPKKALVYNCVSSVLCLLGMIIGILVGNIDSASQWIFSAIAGIFLYVALVGMLPEMKSVSPKAGENPYFHFILQNCGMVLGASIMLIIAIYEDRIDFEAA